MPDSRMVRVNYFLAARQLAALRRLAERSGISVSEWIRRAVDAILEREQRKEKDDGRS